MSLHQITCAYPGCMYSGNQVRIMKFHAEMHKKIHVKCVELGCFYLAENYVKLKVHHGRAHCIQHVCSICSTYTTPDLSNLNRHKLSCSVKLDRKRKQDSLRETPDTQAIGNSSGDLAVPYDKADSHTTDMLCVSTPAEFGFPSNLSCDSICQLNNALKVKGFSRISIPSPHFSDFSRELYLNYNQKGIPPVFWFMQDDPWKIFQTLHPLLSSILGPSYVRLPAFWASVVDSVVKLGWYPHRDRDFDSLYPDGRPKTVTVWVPLSQASTSNSCLYFIPADKDPTFKVSLDPLPTTGKKTRKRLRAENLLSYPITDYAQDIIAMPCKVGEALIFHGAVVHWGGAATDDATFPRVSIAMEFMAGALEPYETPATTPLVIPQVDVRFRMICECVRRYGELGSVNKPWISMCSIFLAASSSESPGYADSKEVTTETKELFEAMRPIGRDYSFQQLSHSDL